MDTKNFIISNCNVCAYYAAMSVLSESRCVLLTGQTSAGKTHLLKTVADEYRKSFPDRKVRIEIFDDIIEQFFSLVKKKTPGEFFEKLISDDLLIIDDMRVAGKTHTQKEIAFWISEILSAQKSIIIATADEFRNLSILTDTAEKTWVIGLFTKRWKSRI